MNRQLFILGDMNCDYFKYPRTEKLKFLSSMYQLQQLISEPTRVTNTSATLIDLIFTNDSNNIAKSGVIYNGMSDHSTGCLKKMVIELWRAIGHSIFNIQK